MAFTKEQMEKLFDNGRKIEAYIRSEIMPKLLTGVRIVFSLDGEEYQLCVNQNELCGMRGGLALLFSEEENTSGSCSVYRPGQGPSFLYALSYHWLGGIKIKFTLNTSVENQRTKNALVFDHFQV